MAEAPQLEQNPCGSCDISTITAFGKAVGDPLRSAVLQALRADSFSVSELCELFDVPQPAMSHHLKILHQANLVAKRREGNSIFYRRDPGHAQAATPEHLQAALFEALDGAALQPTLAAGISRIHLARGKRSEDFFSRHAADVATQQTQIAEPGVYTDTVIEMLSRDGTDPVRTDPRRVLEVGPGDGRLLAWLAGRWDQVTGIDSSEPMLARAGLNTEELDNVALIHGDFLELPGASTYQLIVAAMVIHHLPSPARFFQHARKLLETGGSLIVAELCRHDQQWAGELCGDLWLGFEPGELTRWASDAGLATTQTQFLAQKNGFQIQLQRYAVSGTDQPETSTT